MHPAISIYLIPCTNSMYPMHLCMYSQSIALKIRAQRIHVLGIGTQNSMCIYAIYALLQIHIWEELGRRQGWQGHSHCTSSMHTFLNKPPVSQLTLKTKHGHFSLPVQRKQSACNCNLTKAMSLLASYHRAPRAV